MSKCINCNQNESEVYPSPKDYVSGRNLTLFGWTIILYREKTETIDDLCSECLIDRSNADEGERMAPALDHAYRKGLEDAERFNYG